jgi:hypothetical protein
MSNNNPRDKAIELVEDGFITYEQLATMALKYMSTDDVADMLDCNELSDRFLEDEDDGQPTWEQEWEDFGEDPGYEMEHI